MTEFRKCSKKFKKTIDLPPAFCHSALTHGNTNYKNNMRTKTLVCAAALMAAGVATSMAQSNVYSLNVVGYINITFPANKYTLTANQLVQTNSQVQTLF